MRTTTGSVSAIASRAGLVALLGWVGDPSPPHGRPDTTPQSKEYQLKAQMIRKMIPYVTWPKGTFVGRKTPITIGVVGKDPFGKAMGDAFKNARIKGTRVLVLRFASWSKIKIKDKKRVLGCHALFVAPSERKSLANLVANVRNRPILLISDSLGFATQGAHINFFVSKSKVKFETNPRAAQRAGIKMSSKLLRLGRTIK